MPRTCSDTALGTVRMSEFAQPDDFRVKPRPSFLPRTRGEAKPNCNLSSTSDQVNNFLEHRVVVVGRKYLQQIKNSFQCSSSSAQASATVIGFGLGDANARMALTCRPAWSALAQQVVDARHPFSGNHIMFSIVPDAMSRRSLSDGRTVAEHDSRTSHRLSVGPARKCLAQGPPLQSIFAAAIDRPWAGRYFECITGGSSFLVVRDAMVG